MKFQVLWQEFVITEMGKRDRQAVGLSGRTA